MSRTLKEIAQQLSTPKTIKRTVPENSKTKEIEEVKPVPKVQLIYAFNGTGKTRLSREFKQLIAPKGDLGEGDDGERLTELARDKILYYNAFTEDLFYWDNDLTLDAEPKLLIQPNTFTDWVLKDQGQDRNIITTFQRYSSLKLTPLFSEDFRQVTFSLETGDNTQSGNLKISKGEESVFIWSVFYALLDQVIEILNVPEPADRDTNVFNKLEFVFIDDPVSSLDENHLIELAVDLAQIVKSSKSELRFVITTHNPLFYNVLHNEFRGDNKKYRMMRLDDGTYDLVPQPNDAPFSYHLYLKSEIEQAIGNGRLSKYHFNFLRNILEKTSTFLGYTRWGDLLPKTTDGRTNPYETRIINISSHSKHSGEEIAELTEDDKRVLSYLVNELNSMYRFQSVTARQDTENDV